MSKWIKSIHLRLLDTGDEENAHTCYTGWLQRLCIFLFASSFFFFFFVIMCLTGPGPWTCRSLFLAANESLSLGVSLSFCCYANKKENDTLKSLGTLFYLISFCLFLAASVSQSVSGLEMFIFLAHLQWCVSVQFSRAGCVTLHLPRETSTRTENLLRPLTSSGGDIGLPIWNYHD